jgi:hypothetical protein
MPACSFAVLRLEHFFTQVLESFEFVFATPFTKALPSTQVLCGDKEEYLHGIKERNVLDTVFSG